MPESNASTKEANTVEKLSEVEKELVITLFGVISETK
jgi:hypothetical protein